MDPRVQLMIEKTKVLADVASKKANDLAQTTKLNLQIFDLNTECELLFKEVGKMVFAIHQGKDIAEEKVNAKIEKIQANRQKVEELKKALAERKPIATCPNCKQTSSKEAQFCADCGAKL